MAITFISDASTGFRKKPMSALPLSTLFITTSSSLEYETYFNLFAFDISSNLDSIISSNTETSNLSDCGIGDLGLKAFLSIKEQKQPPAYIPNLYSLLFELSI